MAASKHETFNKIERFRMSGCFQGVGEKENGIDGTREVGKEHTQMVVILAFIQQVMRN